MSTYKEMYSTLFNAITDALALLGKCDNLQAQQILKTAQQKTAEMYTKDETEMTAPQGGQH